MSTDSRLNPELHNANRNALARQYWRKRMSGFAFEPYFGSGAPVAEAAPAESGGTCTLAAGRAISEQLKDLARTDSARYIVLLAGLAALIRKCSYVSDLAVFVPASFGPPDGNVIPFRVSPAGGQTFKELVIALKDQLVEDVKHANYPLDKITRVDEHQLATLPSVGMLVQQVHGTATLGTLPLDMLFAFDLEPALTLTVRYNPARHARETVEQAGRLYFDLLGKLISRKDEKIGTIELASPPEHLADQDGEPAEDETIIGLLARQAAAAPLATALRTDDATTSYAGLAELSDRVAAYLREAAGVGPGNAVGLMHDQGIAAVPWVLGILKCGAVYVPLDPALPPAVLAGIVADARIKLLVTDAAHAQTAAGLGVALLSADEQYAVVRAWGAAAGLREPRGTDLACILYAPLASQSPQGTPITHHSLARYLGWLQRQYPLDREDVVLLHTLPAFGAALWEMAWPLTAGAALCQGNPANGNHPGEMVKAIQYHGVTVLHFCPSQLRVFLNSTRRHFHYSFVGTLRRVFCSGEPLEPPQVDLFGNTLHTYCRTALVHLYGPTEAALPLSHYPFLFDRPYPVVPAGGPAANARLLLLDVDGHPAPEGMAGELCVAGAVASGADGPAGPRGDEKGGAAPGQQAKPVFRTGDLARRNPEGTLELLGRQDDLVRLKGYAISPGHLETSLVRQLPLREAVIVAADVDRKSCLVVYYHPEQALGQGALKDVLASLLPPAVLPEYYVQVDQFPLTPGGKTDRRVLARYKKEDRPGMTAAANETETRLVQLWAEVFGTEEHEISVEDNFFRMGMQSLDSTRFIFKVRKAFNSDISLKKLFQYSTIRHLSDYIRSGSAGEEKEPAAPAQPVKVQVRI